MVPVAWDLCMVPQCGCSQMYLEQAAQTFVLHISPGERDILHQMQVPLALLVWLDADAASRGQSSDSSVPWRTLERRRTSNPLSNSVAWRAGERSMNRHHTSPFNL